MMTEEQADFTKIGVVYASVLLVLSNIIAVDRQSDEIFYLLGVYPYGAGALFWVLIGYLSVGLRPRFGAVISLGAIAAYNYGVAHKLVSQETEALSFVEGVWSVNKLGLTILAAFYLAGQALIVASVIRQEFVKSDAA